eukprot:Tamp_15239.p1 GENE.Tamp_15239~~Tamp_15239.p1  ORF type:complete len:352 (-),score=46.07 Tamp_15239:382-1437(-)
MLADAPLEPRDDALLEPRDEQDEPACSRDGTSRGAARQGLLCEVAGLDAVSVGSLELSDERDEPAGPSRWSQRNLLPDSGRLVARHGLELHVKFLKLVVVVLLLTLFTRQVSCALPGWSCKRDFATADFFKYYWAAQCCDLLVIFFVGRMCGRRGADTPLFLATSLLGSLFPSAQETIPFMRVSFSLYAIMCLWQPMTWVMVAGYVMFLAWITAKHVRHAIATKAALCWAAEAVALVVIFFLPNSTDSAFHMHHWYFAWIIALLARFDPPWSVATQAFMIGYYLNGIAIYGRHPVLACKDVVFLNQQQGCGLIRNQTNTSNPSPIYVPPNPWNCSGDYARRKSSTHWEILY